MCLKMSTSPYKFEIRMCNGVQPLTQSVSIVGFRHPSLIHFSKLNGTPETNSKLDAGFTGARLRSVGMYRVFHHCCYEGSYLSLWSCLAAHVMPVGISIRAAISSTIPEVVSILVQLQ
jgi:hypothetical protein